MFNFFKKDKLPRRVKKVLAPEAKFVKKAKGRFLATFDAHATSVPAKGFAWYTKGAVALLVLAALMVGASAYADTQNVPADNVLYPLKRISESVQLALAPQAEQPALETMFAARRAGEIADLEKRHPTSMLIQSLGNDLNGEVDASINSAEQDRLQDGPLHTFCAKLSSAVLVKGSLIAPRIIARFEGRCGNGAVTTSTATATGTTTITIGTTTPIMITAGVTTTAHATTGIPMPPRRIRQHYPLLPATSSLPLKL